MNEVTTQENVGGPLLVNIYLYDLQVDLLDEPMLAKYAEDSDIISPAYNMVHRSEALVKLNKQVME